MSSREGIAMFETLHMSPRAILLAALIGGDALALAPAARAQTVTARAAQASMLALNFTHEFAGVSQTDHESDLWTGRVGGALSGDLVMTLKLLGSPVEAANPVWKVRTRWTLTAGGDAALVAELYGTVNWKTGMMHLSGAVTEGCLAESEVHVDGRFVDMNGSGILEILPSATFSQADGSVWNPRCS